MDIVYNYLLFLQDTYTSYESIFIALGLFSVVLFIASIIIIPVLVRLIPEDYFINPKYQEIKIHSLRTALLLILRNLLGGVFVILGIIMLVTPGQGLISIIMGLMVMQFRGKYALEQKLIQNNTLLTSINWLRTKMNAPELQT